MTIEAYRHAPLTDGFSGCPAAHIDAYQAAVARELAAT
jgi:GR25 family glycosyltransferase involved in LPS biosynthesis